MNAPSGAAVEIGFRAEHLRIADAPSPGTMTGSVVMVEHLGADIFAHIAVNGIEQPVIVRLGGEAAIAAGGAVVLALEPERAHAFDSEGQRIITKHRVRSAA